ncbi:MAG: ABC transporter permease [Candidatus Aenigmatarchaeota archaeon]
MLDLAIRDLKEHRLRSVLTILGIAIAITAIVSLGSISVGINELITSTSSGIGSDLIFVMKKFDISEMRMNMQIEDIDKEKIEEIASIPNVKRAIPIISKNAPSFFGEVDAIDMDHLDLFGADNFVLKEGYWPDNDDKGAVLGSVIAKMLDVQVGDYIKLNNKDVEVFGIIEEGHGSYDIVIILPYKYGEEIYDMEGRATMVIIEPQDPSYVTSIKNAIEDEYDDLMAMTMEEGLEMAKEMTNTLNIFTFGIGFISSLVAGIGIIITMYTSVLERRRDLGIFKAVGAFRRTIFKQIIEESIILSLIGSFIGLFLSYFFVDLINKFLLGGTNLAIITPIFGLSAILYGIGLSILFSLYPAWLAVKIDPIQAIREG